MNRLIILIGLVAFSIAAAATEEHHRLKIEIAPDDGTAPLSIELDSDETGFSPADLQIGENRSIVDSDGRNILVTRTESGMTLTVDGKVIELPHPPAPGLAPPPHGADPHHVFIETDHTEAISGENVVTILTGRDLDDSQKLAIREAFAATGIDDDIHFVEIGNAAGGEHQMRIIKVVKSGPAEY